MGAVIMLGWVFLNESATQLVSGLPGMKFNTALSFAFLGAASLFYTSQRPLNKAIGALLLSSGLILSLLTLYEYLAGVSLGIDELVSVTFTSEVQAPFPGRMTQATAICFILCFLALASLPLKSKNVQRTAQFMLQTVSFLASVSIFAYLLFVPTDSLLKIFESMAIHTSVSFLIYSIGLSLLHKNLGFVGLFMGEGKGNRLARNLFIRIVLLISGLSILQLLILKNGVVNKEFSIALFGVIFIWVFLALVRRMSLALNTVDDARQVVQKDLDKSRAFLESAPDALFVIDLQGKIRNQNRMAYTQFGYESDELDGKAIIELIPDIFESSASIPSKEFLEDFSSPSFVKKRRLIARRKNGDDFFGALNLTATSLGDLGDQVFFLAILRDLTEQEALESQIHLYDEKLTIAAENSQIGFWEYDILKNQLEWAPSMYRLFHIKKEDFTGDFEAWEQTLLPEDLPLAREEFADALSGKKEFDTSFRIRSSEGNTLHIRAKAKVFKNENGIPFRVLGTNWDVTKEKEAELALEKSHQQTQIFVEQAPIAIAMLDTKMHYIAVSKKWISDYDIAGKEIVGVSHYSIFPEIGEDWKKIHQKCLAGAVNSEDEAEFVREDGTSQWLSWDVRPWYTSENEIGGLIMITANITEQKESIRERLKIENILDKTNQIARLGTWELDLQKSTIHWSKMVRQIHEVPEGYIPDLASGVNFYKEGWSRDAISKAINTCFETGESFDLEVELLTAKENVIWVRAIGSSDAGARNTNKISGIFQDITERKNDELALNTMLGISTDQNERLRNFAHIVSHNLRSHSGNINMMIDLLIDTHPTWQEDEMFQMLQTSSNNLRDTITHLNEVVAMSGSVDQNLTPISLGKSVQSAINQITGTAKEAQVALINAVDEGLIIRGLDAYIDSMLINLISNGIKYRSNKRESFVRIEAELFGEKVKISIRDNGQGIDLKRHGDKLFGMYKTFHGNADARGIGLFITKNQIEAMGGSIEAESKPNEGTTFTILLNHEKN